MHTKKKPSEEAISETKLYLHIKHPYLIDHTAKSFLDDRIHHQTSDLES